VTRTIQSEPKLGSAQTIHEKWRSSMSADRSVAQNVLGSADIVRDRDFFNISNLLDNSTAFIDLPASQT
jgi:hypothetical protein